MRGLSLSAGCGACINGGRGVISDCWQWALVPFHYRPEHLFVHKNYGCNTKLVSHQRSNPNVRNHPDWCQSCWRQYPLKTWCYQRVWTVCRCSNGKHRCQHTDFDGSLPHLLCSGGYRSSVLPRIPRGFWRLLLRVCGPAAILPQCPGVVWARRRTPSLHSEWWNAAVPPETPGPGEGLVARAGTRSSKPHARLCCHWGWEGMWATSDSFI